MIATNPSVSIAPYPIKRMLGSSGIMRGVVPEPIRAWNPLIAPHAITMKQNGKTFIPGSTGPDPSMNDVTAGIWILGWTMATPTTRSAIVPIFM